MNVSVNKLVCARVSYAGICLSLYVCAYKEFYAVMPLYLNLWLIIMQIEADYVQGPYRPQRGQGAQQ